MTVTFHALWTLCALGAVVFATAAASRLRDRLAAAAGFVVAAGVFGPDRLPDPVWTGLMTVAAAAVFLFRPRYAIAPAAYGGALAGMLTALLQVQGLPSAAAVPMGCAVLIVPMWLATTRTGFAPEVLRDEAILLAGGVGLAVAILPGALDGWQAATGLAAASERSSGTAVPVWTVALLTTSTALGALYSVWSRR